MNPSHTTLIDQANQHLQAGLSAQEQGCHQEAVQHLLLARAKQPQSLEIVTALGRSQLALGEVETGLSTLVDALEMQRTYVPALVLLAQGLAEQGQSEEAISIFLRVLDQDSHHPTALLGVGRLFFEHGRWADATVYFQDVLNQMPDHVEARTYQAMIEQRLGHWDIAQALFTDLMQKNPGSARGHNNFGTALLEQSLWDLAVEQFQAALAIQPDYPQAINNLGVTYQKMGNARTALTQFHRALEVKPDYWDAANNLGLSYQNMGQLEEALQAFRLCQRLKPDFADAYFNEGVIWLTRGDWVQGWRGYEWRLKMRKYCNHTHLQQAREISPLPGRSVLVYCEQGFGDAIQFIRFTRALHEKGVRVVVACPRETYPLLATVQGVDHWVVDAEPLPFCDYHVLLLSLPLLLGITTSEKIPATVPYLSADKKQVTYFRRSLAPWTKTFKVGIAWRGNPQHANDRHRSMKPEPLLRLLDIPGLCLINLQKDTTTDERALFSRAERRIVDLTDQLTDFSATAALMDSLDLIITVDTSIAHLAGALAKPVWVLLPAVAEWRWLLERQDSPWYPSMRLFRQATLDDWQGLMDSVMAQLAPMVADPNHHDNHPVPMETS
ncbi:MAG: tetratricopeptide repeat protein [Magnetococcales bacterium]|nr:tetratricopeptide repeat protein [Magnetococcales bacterium]